ncbi:GNAT family N-acetyltransferase [Solicola gregarius]|uniref:GNAT family N-acetyltransferase n=1 Tax=Solicola gregarius TaxID=2908642 RepID=A0AA46YM21_9ACTN|nr:GNAT family N-acetyltransferase [Solicola gregarius]UYM06101.1 GNAT family N-acetyltransferase [Solicola gregarius]
MVSPAEPRSGRPRIRVRTDDDLDTCVRILRSVHEQYAYPVNWPADPRTWLRGESDAAWVAETDGGIAGHVSLAVDGDYALVERLFVDPDRSGAGLGRALLRHGAAHSSTCGPRVSRRRGRR